MRLRMKGIILFLVHLLRMIWMEYVYIVITVSRARRDWI